MPGSPGSRSPNCFNPLFIGADAVTWDAEKCRHRVRNARVSIPCLSGRMLQPLPTIRFGWRTRNTFPFQSPVYRGGCCDKHPAVTEHGSAPVPCAFQSPVYRGGCCNAGTDAHAAATVADPLLFQSPVYRGGCCDPPTTLSRRNRRMSIQFQSPVYRGGCCNRLPRSMTASGGRRGARRFQSPVYRGGCCDESKMGQGVSPRILLSFQSPVYRGGCCDPHDQLTMQRVVDLEPEVSIPCLSGRML